MRRREFLVGTSRAAMSLWALPPLSCIQDESDKTLIADLERAIPALMRKAGVPGLSVALVKDARLLWRRGFGVRDLSSREPVDTDTVFEAASMSKPVFAYAVMKLCEKKVLDLDTPLTRYTPERFVADPRLDQITARHVLSHTTGLPNWRSRDEPLAIRFTPGTKWSYSGEGYSYLQAVVTRLIGGRENPADCGQFELGVRVCATTPSIADFMKANVLAPFGMKSSDYVWTDFIKAHIARGYDPHGTPLPKDRKPTGPTVARYGMAGGLCTTPTDYARFLLEIIDPKPPDAYRLTTASLKEMLRPQVRRNQESSWAVGWEINHTPTGDFIRHGGGNPGYSCFVAGSPERKSGYVIMTNSEDNGYFGVIAPMISGETTLSRVLGGRLRAAPE
jgi:CubicO group peptidase (beta-lactamase class C family)